MRLMLYALIAFALGLSAPLAAQIDSHTHAFTPLPETTVRGVVERVVDAGSLRCELCQACSDCRGTHLVLRKGGGWIDVHLAPPWFLERSGFVFFPGDVVSVTGNRIAIGDEHGIAACEVRRDGVVMKFRDEHGLPLWRRELTDR